MSSKIAKYSKNKIYLSRNRLVYAKIFSSILILLSAVTLLGTEFASGIFSAIPNDAMLNLADPNDAKLIFTYLFIGLMQFIFVILLDMAHGGIYWYRIDKKRLKMDERQIEMRNVVFEKSYYAICVMFILFILFLPTVFFSGLQSISFLFLLFSVPNIIASVQKDAAI